MTFNFGNFTFINPINCLFYGNNEDIINYGLNCIIESNEDSKIYEEDEFLNFYSEITSPSLFRISSDNKIVIIVKEVSDKNYKIYEKLLQNLGEEHSLILFSKELKSTSKIVNLFSSKAGIIKCYDITSSEKSKIISKEIKNKDIAKIIEIVPIQNLIQEIKKVKILINNHNKANLKIDDTLSKNLIDYFQNLNKIHTNDFSFKFANRSLNSITSIPSDIEKVAIIRMILYHFSNLFTAKIMKNNQKDFLKIFNLLKIFFKHENEFKKQVESYNFGEILSTIEKLLQTEINIKTNCDMELEYMICSNYINNNDDV